MYRLIQDNDLHWYVIEVGREDSFWAWVNAVENYEDVPCEFVEVGGPHVVHFKDWGKTMVRKHFVTFFSPGTFVHEETTKEILGWNVKKAVEMARNIKERYGATPFGFQFSIRGREDDELDSDVLERSCMYYLGGKIETREEVEARNLDNERILRDNMRINEIDRVIVNTNSYKITLPFNLDDVLLEFEP